MIQTELKDQWWGIFLRTKERQFAGLDRHFRGPDGFGWFSEDPKDISTLHSARYRIKEVKDYSNKEIKLMTEGGRIYKLAPGSFSIEMDYGKPESGGGVFTFSHPEDIEEFLQAAEVEQPDELIGREAVLYWVVQGANRTVGVGLPEFSIPLSELIKRDQGK